MVEDSLGHMSDAEKQRLSERNVARSAEQDRQVQLAAGDQSIRVTSEIDAKCREMIEELRSYDPDAGDGSGKRQSDWDVAFLDDVANEERAFSYKQANKIADIWKRIFDG